MTGGSFLVAIRGPVLLVALGLLLAADQLDRMSFARTWPVLLILFGLFKTSRSIGSIFQSSPNWSGQFDLQFQSRRNGAFRDWMDPSKPGRYYRSVVGNFNLSAATIRNS